MSDSVRISTYDELFDLDCRFFEYLTSSWLSPRLLKNSSPLVVGGVNPLDGIDAASPAFLQQCRVLARTLIGEPACDGGELWVALTESVLTVLIALVSAAEPNPAERNLTTVQLIVCDPKKLARAFVLLRHWSLRPPDDGLSERSAFGIPGDAS